MALIERRGFNPFDGFFNDDDDFFFPSVRRMGVGMAVDVYEEDGNVVAEMNLPGLSPDDIDVSVEDGVLTIKGERSEEKEDKNKRYYAKQIRRGSFERSVKLPKHVDIDEASADYEDGVLKVALPIKEEKDKESHQITVNS